ncbi:putative cystatin-9-like protein cst9lp1 [Saguinus oedipus]|uniref:Cystatin-9-like protein cst9lp1 n=1 Tax=Saguinus oedipus TaxID=9490 RepID=A0ABQ9VKP8_SAGOE|nr:putative cystatin-9-like protein cst9lp1 [Saguinus oedipus]
MEESVVASSYKVVSSPRVTYEQLKECSFIQQGYDKTTFSMNLQLGRTTCGKFEDDIDNCPFQQGPELNNTHTCFFTIGIEPWRTHFELWNKTCSAGRS